ncbi:MAG: YkgJ family cysteine cluster protein [Gemmatimonadales bacterium]
MAAPDAGGIPTALVTFRDLLGQLDAWFGRGVADAGPGVVLCRRGCAACCLGPFDISPADAALVANAVDRLEPATRSLIQSRTAGQVARYAEFSPGWHAPWDVDAIDDRCFDGISDALADLPCPALGDDGGCLIYEDRPATCRMIGLSMLTPEDDQLDNACPILHTSQRYAELAPTRFDLAGFESAVDRFDAEARAAGWVSTTVGGAILGRAPGN